MSVIIDGQGSGYRAGVTNDNRLRVDAITEDTYVNAAEAGRAFNLNTEAVLYSDTAPWVKGALYVMNNESVSMEVVGWFIGELNDRTGGSTTAPLLFKMYGNPTSVVGGTAIDVVNRRIGAARQFDIDARKGITSYSVTGSPLLYQYQYGGRAFGTVNFTIPPGQSIMIEVTSQTDSFTAYTGFTGYVGA